MVKARGGTRMPHILRLYSPRFLINTPLWRREGRKHVMGQYSVQSLQLVKFSNYCMIGIQQIKHKKI